LSHPQRVLVAVADAEDFVVRVMRAHDVPAADAAVVAQCLLRADLRCVTTHGLMRLPVYTDRLRRRLVSARPDLVVTRTTAATARVDGGNALGFVVAHRAMSGAIALAREAGIGMVGARHSNHFGMAASYVLQAAEAGLAAMVFTNASPAIERCRLRRGRGGPVQGLRPRPRRGPSVPGDAARPGYTQGDIELLRAEAERAGVKPLAFR
jgi:LDH2 family malate/lactate/ureidoglycolate dehydrogenase